MRDCWSGKAVIWIIGKYATKFAGLCGELCVCLGAGSGNEAFAWHHRDRNTTLQRGINQQGGSLSLYSKIKPLKSTYFLHSTYIRSHCP